MPSQAYFRNIINRQQARIRELEQGGGGGGNIICDSASVRVFQQKVRLRTSRQPSLKVAFRCT